MCFLVWDKRHHVPAVTGALALVFMEDLLTERQRRLIAQIITNPNAFAQIGQQTVPPLQSQPLVDSASLQETGTGISPNWGFPNANAQRAMQSQPVLPRVVGPPRQWLATPRTTREPSHPNQSDTEGAWSNASEDRASHSGNVTPRQGPLFDVDIEEDSLQSLTQPADLKSDQIDLCGF